jgi:hypothetical protein
MGAAELLSGSIGAGLVIAGAGHLVTERRSGSLRAGHLQIWVVRGNLHSKRLHPGRITCYPVQPAPSVRWPYLNPFVGNCIPARPSSGRTPALPAQLALFSGLRRHNRFDIF